MCFESRGQIIQSIRLRGNLRQTEIQHLYFATRLNHDIRRFDVTVCDALAVRSIQGVSDLNAEVSDFVCFENASANLHIERLTFDIFHDNEVRPIRLADFIGMSDIDVIERRRGLSFVHKTTKPFSIAGKIRRENLQRNLATQSRISRQVHFSHSALPEFLQDMEMRKFIADH